MKTYIFIFSTLLLTSSSHIFCANGQGTPLSAQDAYKIGLFGGLAKVQAEAGYQAEPKRSGVRECLTGKKPLTCNPSDRVLQRLEKAQKTADAKAQRAAEAKK